MVLDLMHAEVVEDGTPAGMVTMGGTDSILHAVLAYRVQLEVADDVDDAETVVVALGSVLGSIQEVVDDLRLDLGVAGPDQLDSPVVLVTPDVGGRHEGLRCVGVHDGVRHADGLVDRVGPVLDAVARPAGDIADRVDLRVPDHGSVHVADHSVVERQTRSIEPGGVHRRADPDHDHVDGTRQLGNGSAHDVNHPFGDLRAPHEVGA